MSLKKVEFLELNDNFDQDIIHRFIFEDGKIKSEKLKESNFTSDIEALLNCELEVTTSKGPIKIHPGNDPEEFLKALKYKFNGTYLRATDLIDH